MSPVSLPVGKTKTPLRSGDQKVTPVMTFGIRSDRFNRRHMAIGLQFCSKSLSLVCLYICRDTSQRPLPYVTQNRPAQLSTPPPCSRACERHLHQPFLSEP